MEKYRAGQRHSPWAVYDSRGVLICLCVYKKGAEAVVARLREATAQAEKPVADSPSLVDEIGGEEER